MAYILAHCQNSTRAEMCAVLKLSRCYMTALCHRLGVAPVTKTDRQIAAIKAAGGLKTQSELADDLEVGVARVNLLVHRHGLPFKEGKLGRRRLSVQSPVKKMESVQKAEKPRPPAIYSNVNHQSRYA